VPNRAQCTVHIKDIFVLISHRCFTCILSYALHCFCIALFMDNVPSDNVLTKTYQQLFSIFLQIVSYSVREREKAGGDVMQ